MSIREMTARLLRDDHKAILKLCYGIAKEPKHAKRYYNRLMYSRNVLRTPRISFTPPAFIATIAENCNLACPSCLYLLKDPDKFYSSFIDKNEFLRVLEKYNKEKVAETIFLTGGEPLLHPEIDEIIDICKEFNLRVCISTNGILVKSRIESMLKLDYVNVSVDSYDYETFKKNRGGSPAQFDLIRDGLIALKENGIYFSVSYLLSRENMFEFHKMIEFAELMKTIYVSLVEKTNPSVFSANNIKN
jgi:MoaA/NifB/PqqE/SkfB family radical SAM enzyme